MPSLTSLKTHILSLIRPKIKSIFDVHDPLGLRYLFQLRVNFSPLRSHKRQHNLSDTPSETCECNLGIEDTRHFLFEYISYARVLAHFVWFTLYVIQVDFWFAVVLAYFTVKPWRLLFFFRKKCVNSIYYN